MEDTQTKPLYVVTVRVKDWRDGRLAYDTCLRKATSSADAIEQARQHCMRVSSDQQYANARNYAARRFDAVGSRRRAA